MPLKASYHFEGTFLVAEKYNIASVSKTSHIGPQRRACAAQSTGQGRQFAPLIS